MILKCIPLVRSSLPFTSKGIIKTCIVILFFFSESEGLLHFEFRYLQLLYDDVFWAIQSFNSKYSSELPTHEAQIVTFNTIRSLEMIDFIKGTLKVGSVLIRNQYVNRSFTFCHSRLHQFF